MRVTISVLVPDRDAQEHIARCPQALRESDFEPIGAMVADRASSGVEISL
jgi:hypothetical protein